MKNATVLKEYKNHIDLFDITLSLKNKKYEVLLIDTDPCSFGDVCIKKRYNTLEEAEGNFDSLLKFDVLLKNE